MGAAFYIRKDASNDLFRIYNSGYGIIFEADKNAGDGYININKFGINATSPDESLHVSGNTQIEDGSLIFRDDAADDEYSIEYGAAAYYLDFVSPDADFNIIRYQSGGGTIGAVYGRRNAAGTQKYFGLTNSSLGFVFKIDEIAEAVKISNSNANVRIWIDDTNDNIMLGNGVAADASAVVEIECPDPSTNPQGFLPPRMTTTQRDNISSPATGLMIYNTTTNYVDVYDGTTWQQIRWQ